MASERMVMLDRPFARMSDGMNKDTAGRGAAAERLRAGRGAGGASPRRVAIEVAINAIGQASQGHGDVTGQSVKRGMNEDTMARCSRDPRQGQVMHLRQLPGSRV
jgi:hypothetical protein